MNTEEKHILKKTEIFVKETLRDAEKGHDWWHILRVHNLAVKLVETEQGNAFICRLGALLHDIADSKFHNGDESVGPRTARNFLQRLEVSEEIIRHIENIISHISFKGGHTEQKFMSRELAVIQDADRLDAMGAIGIARTFHYGGFKNRELYNPAVPPVPDMTREQYKNSTAPTLNHFHEKLLLLKDRMNTDSGRIMAEKRHDYMLGFLNEFHLEWNGVN